MVHYRSIDASGHNVFYRETGNPKNPTLLLLHGFPTSSHMFRNLIPLLADRYHLVAPDLPGFANTVSPPRGRFDYTFDNLARVIGGFVNALGFGRYAMYVFDYGAPVGYRLAVAHPERVAAIVSQNGNAYLEGHLVGIVNGCRVVYEARPSDRCFERSKDWRNRKRHDASSPSTPKCG